MHEKYFHLPIHIVYRDYLRIHSTYQYCFFPLEFTIVYNTRFVFFIFYCRQCLNMCLDSFHRLVFFLFGTFVDSDNPEPPPLVRINKVLPYFGLVRTVLQALCDFFREKNYRCRLQSVVQYCRRNDVTSGAYLR